MRVVRAECRPHESACRDCRRERNTRAQRCAMSAHEQRRRLGLDRQHRRSTLEVIAASGRAVAGGRAFGPSTAGRAGASRPRSFARGGWSPPMPTAAERIRLVESAARNASLLDRAASALVRSCRRAPDVDVVLAAIVGSAGLREHLGGAGGREDGRPGEQRNAGHGRPAGDATWRRKTGRDDSAGRQRAQCRVSGACRPGGASEVRADRADRQRRAVSQSHARNNCRK